LEKSHEGLAAGVREVLQAAGEAADGAFAEVRGLVADLLQVDVDVAPLVDVALGERAQHLALSGDSLLEEIQAGRYRPPGRVGFIRLNESTAEQGLELGDRPGVIGRADRLVSCSAACESMKQQLLGDTWFVASLSIAMALRATAAGSCRFVTATGELLERDGAVIVGPRLTGMGLVSRRSELRELNQQLEEMEQQLEELSGEVETLTATRQSQRRGVEELSAEHAELRAAFVNSEAQMRTLRERSELLDREQAASTAELLATTEQQQTLAKQLETDRATLIELEAKATATEEEVRRAEARIDEAESSREEHAREATAAKVELAKSEQRLDSLRARMTQFEEDQRERDRAIEDSRTQLDLASRRLLSTQRDILSATSELAELYLLKEHAAAEIETQARERKQLVVDKAEIQAALQVLRHRSQKLDESHHKQELAATDLQHERRTVAERIQEDYGIDLAEASKEPTAEEQLEREEVEREINDLRRKLNSIGAVNTDALNELDDLDTRYTSLSSQFNDLVQAKEALERIIQKINADSRRLFEETLEIIRANFQILYRKAFGGGRADLVLEEGVDPLEAGVDIIATPPGKPSFSNSLLSGGEKALTAVALLLAIFQYRPSPFCVLDEVDAPFDEANIGRFVDVLHGFLDWTKFIVVTHSKKTMTAATTLYGVTMQESGVSKRVSVRFEDVSEDGHISEEAVERSEDGKEDTEAA
jgi:chromosome segregation protein